MSGQSKQQRTDRALDALLVSVIRLGSEKEIDAERLPELTKEERAALDSLGPDFMDRILAGETSSCEERGPATDCGKSEPVLSGSFEGFGLNRAQEIEAETADELERRRREIVERKAREREKGGRSSA